MQIIYLHHEVAPHIIHRDIKAGNVLLDSDFHPLVADFGFAKLIPEGVSHMTTRVKGTLGYLAPEYAMWGKVSESCDVYSFGILLLEISTGRKPIERLPGGIKRTITEFADPFIASDHLPDLVDPRLRGAFDETELRRILHAAARCVHSDPDRRPTMRKVLSILQGTAAAADPSKRIGDGFGESNVSPEGVIRITSVKYGEELMDMDYDDEEEEKCVVGEKEEEDDVEFSRSGSDGASVFGVFGRIEVQKVRCGTQQQPEQQVVVGNSRRGLRG